MDVALKFIGRDLLKAKRLILNRQMDSIQVSDSLRIFPILSRLMCLTRKADIVYL